MAGIDEGATWYRATAAAAPERRALTHDLDVDCCVIGAGLAGLTVARELARRGWDVAVLDAGTVAGGASGRNGGFVSPGFSERIDAIIARVGPSRARELWALSESGVEYIRRAIVDDTMPDVNPREGRLSVRRVDDEPALIEHAAMLRVDFGAEVEAWPTDQVREVLRSPHYFQALHFPKAFHIHPLNYALGLAAAAEKAGVRIFEGTRALSLDPAGVRKRIETPHAAVRARHVVLAGSHGIGAVDAPVAETILPVATYVAVTKPIGETLFDAVRYSGAVADNRRAGDYYRIVADDRLMWGGRITTRLAEPRRLAALMRRDMLAVYPQLGAVEIEYAWSGVMGYAVHKMPQIGELAPGYWIASAFGGHGLNTTAMAGEMIARAILDGDDRWRLFSSYELVWAGGRYGRAAVQASYWSMQTRDWLHERVARYRDRARRESDARHARWDAEKAARKAAEEQRRADDAAQVAAAREERRRSAEEARRLAAERAEQARQETIRLRAEREHAVEDAKRAAEEAARLAAEAAAEAERRAAEKALQDAADAAAALARQIEDHKAAVAQPLAPSPPTAGEAAPPAENAVQDGEAPSEPQVAAPEAPVRNGRSPRKKGAPRSSKRKKKEAPREPPPPST